MTLDDAAYLADLCMTFGLRTRATRHADGSTPETVTTHTVMLALIAGQFASEQSDLDVGRVVTLALVHDLVEALVGDTDSYRISPEAKAEKEAREAEGLRLLRAEAGHHRWLMEAIDEYEAKQTAEARVVYILDKAMPSLTHPRNRHSQLKARGETRAGLRAACDARIADLAERFPDLPEARALYQAVVDASCDAWGDSPLAAVRQNTDRAQLAELGRRR